MTNRNPFVVFLLCFITFGIYHLVWLVSTKREMNELGGGIPTAWLLIVPFANFYWLWKYSESAEEITGGNSALANFALLFFLPSVGPAILQSSFNHVEEEPIRIQIFDVAGA